MANFEIKSSEINSNYRFSDTNIIVTGTFSKDAITGKVTSINGYCYRNNDDVLGDNFGYFNGYPADDEISYDLSQMKRADSNIVWDAIDAIEPHVLGTAE